MKRKNLINFLLLLFWVISLLFVSLWTYENPENVVENFIETHLPMGKFGWPEPVGDIVAFLASERASLITGACIVVDGGQSHSMI